MKATHFAAVCIGEPPPNKKIMPKINRQEVYRKCDGHCGYCGKVIAFEKMQVDHIRPKHYFYHGVRRHFQEKFSVSSVLVTDTDRFTVPDYEVDDLRNLMPSCARCNRWKSTLSLEKFRKEISLQLERLRNYSTNYNLALDFGLIQENQIEIKFYFEQMEYAENPVFVLSGL